MAIAEVDEKNKIEDDYVSSKLFEAFMEAALALEFLKRGFTRKAAGKAFQAWKSILTALLRLERERLKASAKSEEERRWFEENAVSSIPTTTMALLSQALEKLGYRDVGGMTILALDLYDYQRHGPGPDMVFSIFNNREVAAWAIKELVEAVAEYAERLKERVVWTKAHEEALNILRH